MSELDWWLPEDYEYEKEQIPERIGDWWHIHHAGKELKLYSCDRLLDLLYTNGVAFPKVKLGNLSKCRLYLHDDWVAALEHQFPIAKYCLLQKHIRTEDFTPEEWNKRIKRQKPKDLASDAQVWAIRDILKSDLMLVGEIRWVEPVLQEQWISADRAYHIIQYFRGYNGRHLEGWERIYPGVFDIRKRSLLNHYENKRRTAEITLDDFDEITAEQF